MIINIPRLSNSYFFSSTCFVFLSRCQLTVFFTRGSLLVSEVSNNLKCVLNIGVGILIGQKRQKCYQFGLILIFELIILENYSLKYSIKVCFDGVILLNESYFEQPPILFLILETWQAENVKRSKYYSYFVDFQTHGSINLPASGLPTRFTSRFFCQWWVSL